MYITQGKNLLIRHSLPSSYSEIFGWTLQRVIKTLVAQSFGHLYYCNNPCLSFPKAHWATAIGALYHGLLFNYRTWNSITIYTLFSPQKVSIHRLSYAPVSFFKEPPPSFRSPIRTKGGLSQWWFAFKHYSTRTAVFANPQTLNRVPILLQHYSFGLRYIPF